MIRYSFICLFVLVINGLMGQQTGIGIGQHSISIQLPSIALLDIEPGDHNVNLEILQPTDAGDPVVLSTQSSDNSLWINYSSAVATSIQNRSINARLTGGNLPSGLLLKLSVAQCSGACAGISGTSVGTIILSGIAQNIISGIKGTYTGNGSGNGHRLTYFLEVNDYGELYGIDNEIITITYTITEN